MKKYIITVLAVLCTGLSAMAQMRTAYFMQASTFRSDLNPAFAPQRGYVNFPIIGATGIDINNNFLSLRNFVYPNPNGDGSVLFLHPDIDKSDFLKRLPENNTLAFDTSFNLIGFGAYAKKFFWSAGINVRTSTEMVLPKDMFRLLTTLGEGYYDMSKLHADMSAYTEIFVGASVPVFDWLTVGGRVKGLIGIANLTAEVNNSYFNVSPTDVSGRLMGTVKFNSAFSQSVAAGEEVDFDDIFDFGTFGLSSGGFAVDLGAEGRFLDDRLRASIAITDLGFISWGKGHTVSTNLSAGFKFNGYNFDEKSIDSNVDDVTLTAGDSNEGYTKRLTTSLNIGAEYTFLEDRISVGVLSHTRFGQNSTLSELTISGNFRPLNWLSASISHTFFSHNRFGVFGFALNVHPKGFNLFLGSDFINFKVAKGAPVPVNMTSANVYMGLGFTFGKAHHYKGSKFYKAEADSKK